MSLALWMYFWDDTAWDSAPPPTPAPTAAPATTTESLGGKPEKRSKRRNPKPEYIRAGEDFWYIREKYLQSIQAETLPDLPPAPKPSDNSEAQPAPSPRVNHVLLPRYTAERSHLITALRTAETLADLQATGARLIELNLAIRQALRDKAKFDFEQRKAQRQREIRRARRRLAILRAYQLLLKILQNPRGPLRPDL